jgi:phage-related protein
MLKIIFYAHPDGSQPVRDYLLNLASQSGKENRVKLNKIHEYIEILKQYGALAGEPYLKHIEDGIWELRPQNNRIFFFLWKDSTFVLLHYFIKKTPKTPRREILRAQCYMRDYIKRSEKHED